MNTLVLTRGCPSSGKSTLTRQFYENHYAQRKNNSCVVCSADDWHMVDGIYKWHPDKVKFAHTQCQELARTAAANCTELILIDNTSLTERECRPYLDIANDHGYIVWLIEAPNNDLPAEELFKRNVHGVPLATIERMITKFVPNHKIVSFANNNFPDLEIHSANGRDFCTTNWSTPIMSLSTPLATK